MTAPIRLEYVDPASLGEHPRNWRTHGPDQLAAFGGLLAEVGWADALLYNERSGRLLDGHMRRLVALENRLPAVPVIIGSWDDAAEAKILASRDTLGMMAGVDPVAWDALLRDVDTGCSELMGLLSTCSENFGTIPPDEKPKAPPRVRSSRSPELPGDDEDDDEGEISPADREARADNVAAQLADQAVPDEDDPGVPDVVFASDNEWDIPTLDRRFMADAPDFPNTLWGSIGRGREMLGTYWFYCDDYKFNALWKDPSVLIKSGCRNIVEPNFSTHDQVPRYEMLHRIARKRWVARWAQTRGIRVFVDLNVAPAARELNLLGVPKGWLSWATRSQDGGEGLEAAFDLAAGHAGTDRIVFAVYGGVAAVKSLCAERGWYWIPEQVRVARGLESPAGGTIDG